MKEEITEYSDLVDHVHTHGASKGKVHKKQEWKHKHSQHTFTWYHKQAKAQFNTSQLRKAAKQVNNMKFPGFHRVSYLLNLVSRDVTHNDINAKYLRDKDIRLRVKAYLAAVGSNSPLSIFDNPFMQEYISDLNPRYSTGFVKNKYLKCCNRGAWKK